VLSTGHASYDATGLLLQDMMLFQHKMEETGRKFDPSKCLLVVDDWMLPIGKAVFRLRGGHDTSYFLQEIAQVMDISEMPRLRVGIGSKPLAISLCLRRSDGVCFLDAAPAVRLMDEEMVKGWLMGEFDNLGKAVVPRMQPR
jgi:peptidyl-tRNA hydrolase